LKIFSGKLKSCWSDPFTISEIYPYGTAKLIHPDGCNFKVNCHRLKHYHGGDPPPLEISDDYPPMVEAFLCRILSWFLRPSFFGKYYPPSRTGRMMKSKAKWDPANVIFENWSNDEIVLTNGKVSDHKEEYSYEDGDITYEEYKDDWIYGWNKDVPWVHEKPWTDNRGDYENAARNNAEREPNDGNDIGNLDYDLVRDNASYPTNEEEEQDDEDRCELLGDPNQEPPSCEIRRFEMIKYSFGPAEKYIAIK
nr:reverse transcriptase domain-containing protein [Tanacetum cinerariifolium]